MPISNFPNGILVGALSPDRAFQVIGDAKFGDADTNYAYFDVDGELTLVGTARVTKHIHLNEENFRLGSASPVEALIGHYPVLQFSNVSTQTIDILFHIPEDWDSTTDMLLHIHWAPVDGNAGDVVWDFDYHVSEPEANEVLTGTTRSLSVTDSTQSLQDEHLKTADVTMPVGDLLPGHIIGLCVSRDTADAADTYGSAASFILAEILYIANKLGEAT